MPDNKHWIVDGDGMREATAEDLDRIGKEKATGPLKRGDTVYLTLSGEPFHKMRAADKLLPLPSQPTSERASKDSFELASIAFRGEASP